MAEMQAAGREVQGEVAGILGKGLETLPNCSQRECQHPQQVSLNGWLQLLCGEMDGNRHYALRAA